MRTMATYLGNLLARPALLPEAVTLSAGHPLIQRRRHLVDIYPIGTP